MQQRPLLSPAILLVDSPQVNELTVPYSVSFTIPRHSHGLCYCSPTTPTKGSSRHSASGHQMVTGQTCLDCELGACSILRRLMKSRWEGLFRNIWHFFLTIAPEEVGSWLLKILFLHLLLKITSVVERSGNVAQFAEHLPSMHEAWGSIPRPG